MKVFEITFNDPDVITPFLNKDAIGTSYKLAQPSSIPWPVEG